MYLMSAIGRAACLILVARVWGVREKKESIKIGQAAFVFHLGAGEREAVDWKLSKTNALKCNLNTAVMHITAVQMERWLNELLVPRLWKFSPKPL